MFVKLIKKYSCNVFVIFIFVLLLVLYVAALFLHPWDRPTRDEDIVFDVDKNYSGRYLPGNDSCLIPDFSPRDPSILKYLDIGHPFTCGYRPPLTYTKRVGNRHVLRIDTEVVHRHGTDVEHLECCYRRVIRYNENTNTFSNCINFKLEAFLNVNVEYILVKCDNTKTGNNLYENMHAVVPLKPVGRRVDDNLSPQPAHNYPVPNVLLLGIDSISRLSLQRSMPLTIEYLLSENWIELRKYNKIGDNTMPNEMAVLSGLDEPKLRKINCFHGESQGYMDHCPFIWNDFRQKGYFTAYAEDSDQSTFNYNGKGFSKSPTDYYYRPFMLGAIKNLHTIIRDLAYICLGPTTNTDNILKYAADLFDAHQQSLFALIWLNNFSHNSMHSPALMDQTFLQFMQNLKGNGTMNNTFVVFFSDHGIRFGAIRSTYVGWLEERLPFFYVWVPEWFRQAYPDAYKNLVYNGDRLTSPYDVHLMLKDILADSAGVVGKGTEGCPTCQSLFTRISKRRRCSDAGITPHWCACAREQTQIPIDDVIESSVLYAIDTIQEQLNATEVKCAVLTLKNITEARIKEKESDDYKDFVVVFETVPGLAKFDASIRYWPGNSVAPFAVIGIVSRINAYGNQSECMPVKELKLYCYCLNEVSV